MVKHIVTTRGFWNIVSFLKLDMPLSVFLVILLLIVSVATLFVVCDSRLRKKPVKPIVSNNSQFIRAVDYLRQTRRISETSVKLKFYGLYKQATEGDNKTRQPSAFNLEGRAKWDAWTAEAGKTREVAEDEYVVLLSRHIPDWRA